MTPSRLRDKRWDLTDFTLEDGTVLNGPRIRIENINYNAPTLTAMIDVRFSENQGAANYEHSRTFPYTLEADSQESISAENVQAFIESIFPDAIEIE